jgi:hypothetical protein
MQGERLIDGRRFRCVRPVQKGKRFESQKTCVWQSQAPSGTSKPTRVAGCEAAPYAGAPFLPNTAVAIPPTSSSRRVTFRLKPLLPQFHRNYKLRSLCTYPERRNIQRHSKSDSPIGLHCGGKPCLRQYSGRCQCCIACFRPWDVSHAGSSRAHQIGGSGDSVAAFILS